MQGPKWPRLIPALLVLLALLWSGWYFYQLFERSHAEQRVVKALGEHGRDDLQTRIKDQVDLVRREYERHGGPVLAMLLGERLALAAWFYPEESPGLLKESIALNRQVFETEAGGLTLVDASTQMDYIAYTLAWSYFTAGLYEQFSSWKNEVIARAPGFRSGLLALEASALVLRDQVQAVADLAESEVEARAASVQTSGIAAAAYNTIGRFAAAAKYAEDARVTEGTDPNVQIALAACAIAQEDFHSASQLLRGTLADHGSDPELEQELLAAVVGAQGAGSAEAQRIAERASGSTRYPRSPDGALAVALGRLYFLTLSPDWLERLGKLAQDNPDDFAVQAAYAQALLDADDARRFDAARSGRNWRGPQTPVDLAAASAPPWRLARSETQKKVAAILQARALAHQGVDNAALESGSLDWLKSSLGIQGEVAAIPGGVIAPYDTYLLDHCVRHLRTRSSSFDAAVHESITAFLEQQQAEYAGAVRIPLGSFGRPASPSGGPVSSTQIESRVPKHPLTGEAAA